MNPIRIARRLLALFAPAERRQAGYLVPAMIVQALMETVGVASVMPFLAVVANPGTVDSNAILHRVYTMLGFGTVNGFLIFLGVSSLVVLLVSNVFSAWVVFLLHRYALAQNHHLQTRLMTRYLARPYPAFLGSNTAELGNNILVEVSEVITGILMPSLQTAARSVAAVSILVLLVAVDPVLALTVTVALGSLYALVFLLVRRTLIRVGQERQAVGRTRFQSISEAFSGIKDVKVSGRERAFLSAFEGASARWSYVTTVQRVIKAVPKYALEVVAFGGILLIVLYLLTTGRPLSGLLPIIGLYAFASYRLMPAVQQVFESIAQMRYSLPALDVLERDMAGFDAEAARFPSPAPLGLRDAIELHDVHFDYPGSDRPSVEGISLRIPARTSVALVGSTGSGKTTTVDLILGLLAPGRGAITIDGEPLEGERLRPWQASVGYVPQEIFLTDNSVAHNIAFGVADEDLDMEAVERAARIAQIHDFVHTLPDGYDTVIGERGTRISGGQRQRLGIARALYRDPDVLVFDEATSALDGVTESDVFDALDALAGHKTILMIAHRLTTVAGCDAIYQLEHGRVVARGRYQELLESSPQFRALAQQQADPHDHAPGAPVPAL